MIQEKSAATGKDPDQLKQAYSSPRLESFGTLQEKTRTDPDIPPGIDTIDYIDLWGDPS